MIKYISSLQNKIIKDAYSLKDNRSIKENKKFLIEGDHLISMAKNNLIAIFTLKELEGYSDIDQYIVNEEIMKKLSSGKSIARVIGICKIKEDDFKYGNTLIYLDNIQDPGNLGTILRTCLGMNIKNILVSEDCVFRYNQKTIQASQGAVFEVNLKVNDKNELIKLKEEGYSVVSTTLQKDSIFLNDLKMKDKIIFIFGNEGNGIKKELINISNEKIIIPINNIDSYNVSIALSIVLYTYLYNK